jgi:hypothetical protein
MPKMTKELTHYDAVIADLEAERDQLNTMIAMLRQKKTGAPAATVSTISSSRPIAEAIPGDAFFWDDTARCGTQISVAGEEPDAAP